MKQQLLSLLALCLMGVGSAFAQSEIVVGDMNDDGQLTVSDVTSLTQTVIGKAPRRTISTKCDPNASDPAAIAGSWRAVGGATLTLTTEGHATYSPDATVHDFEYYPYGRVLVLLNEGGYAVKYIPVVRLSADYLVLGQPDGSCTAYYPADHFANGFVMSATSLALQTGQTQQLSVLATPEGSIAPVFTWTSSNPAVATVDQNGLVTAVKGGTATITATANDGSGVKAECVVTVPEPVVDSHEYVDLGLPSGTLWATCNVGADNPEDYGDYFAWGEVEPKSTYNESTYFDSNYEKYNNNGGKTELDLEDDAAYMNWGEGWRMPSSAQQDELRDTNNCTWTWTNVNGKNGYLVKSKRNGSSLFLPAAGCRGEGSLGVGSCGYYWSRSLYAGFSDGRFACDLVFSSSYVGRDWYSRCYGWSVRPVRVECSVSVVQLVESITLSAETLTLAVDESTKLTVTVLPEDADDRTYTWSSSNPAVATVDQNGLVTAVKGGTATITATANDGSGVKAECVVTVPEPVVDSHEYVDLGLPSGTLWATCNVGADNPEDYGDYFAWGEVEPKSTYNMSTYFDSNFKKYNNFGGKTELDLEDDAAYMNWGEGWRMPSRAQLDELLDPNNSTWTWTNVNGKNGYLVKSKRNGSSLFLPAAGDRYEGSLSYAGSWGEYWSRSLNSSYYSDASNLGFESDGIGWGTNNRYFGYSVRPVRVECSVSVVQLVESITLSAETLTLAVDESTKLTVTVLPEDAGDRTYTWSSSNPAVATVDQSGLVTAVKGGTATITATANDGSGVKAECVVTVPEPVVDSHEYVDLGLPSGTLWATCNVGADNPEDYGDYFAWGEVEPKSTYNWSTYFDSNYEKYNNNGGKTELDLEDDAAYMNWGEGWRMPSDAQQDELCDTNNCTWTWTNVNGKNGYLVKSKRNGSSLFLPAAGCRDEGSLDDAGSWGYYWSRSLDTSNADSAYGLSFGSGDILWGIGNRYYGFSVRPVRVSGSE